uniref:DNA (cytosine-5-)-methyltransferase n=1 Tax=Aminivibrio sp. TaxID=1872489 RepID=UPI00345E282C
MEVKSRDEKLLLLKKARSFFTQEELSMRVGCSKKTIARWESGQTKLPLHVGPALEKIIGEMVPRGASGENDFTFIDLFAGIGGIRLGFEKVGGKCVFTSEWDEYARKTYSANFPEEAEIAGDITKVEASEIPDHDILLAGFPCQPFSIAGVSKKNALGMPHGFECATQGTLFFDVARIIAEKKPYAFVLENVKNLLSHDKGRTFEIIRCTLEDELGYFISWRVFDGRYFVPQHRERIIIVGFRSKVPFNLNDIPLNVNEKIVLKSILHPEDGSEADFDNGRFIDESGQVRDKYTLTERLWEYLQCYAEKHRAKGNGFGYGLVTGNDVSRTLSARYYKDGSEILVSRGDDSNPRRLTPRECAR